VSIVVSAADSALVSLAVSALVSAVDSIVVSSVVSAGPYVVATGCSCSVSVVSNGSVGYALVSVGSGRSG
jgi:hypothetical protein